MDIKQRKARLEQLRNKKKMLMEKRQKKIETLKNLRKSETLSKSRDRADNKLSKSEQKNINFNLNISTEFNMFA